MPTFRSVRQRVVGRHYLDLLKGEMKPGPMTRHETLEDKIRKMLSNYLDVDLEVVEGFIEKEKKEALRRMDILEKMIKSELYKRRNHVR